MFIKRLRNQQFEKVGVHIEVEVLATMVSPTKLVMHGEHEHGGVDA